MHWLNRLGLLFTFFSFWLAAPEVLGEQKLKAIYRFGLIGSMVALYLPIATLLYLLIIAIPVLTLTPLTGTLVAVVTIIASLITAALSFFVLKFLQQSFVDPLLLKLADNHTLRRQLLLTGAVLFTLGFLLQFTSTF